jgi:hypothetical protein
MGISISIYPVTDSQISRFGQDPSQIDEFINSTPNHRGCYLTDFWDGLHFLLTGRPDSAELMFYFNRLRDVALEASAKGQGLSFQPLRGLVMGPAIDRFLEEPS